MTVLMGLQARLRLARLYLCTDARSERGDLAEFCEAVFAGGVDILQIRQKEMDPDEELEALQVARRAAERHRAIVCVNDSPALAERFSADVLHLGQTDGSSRRARRTAPVGAARPLHPRPETDRPGDRRLRRRLLLRRSRVRDVDQTGLRAGGPGPGEVCRRGRTADDLAAKPWFAIGGIDPDNLDEVLDAGARRVCVVRALTLADDPEAAARELSTRLRQAWRADPAMEQYSLGAAGYTGPPR